MNASKEKYFKTVFLISTIYDLVLGIVFTFFNKNVFELLKIPEKLEGSEQYVTLIGAYVIVFGISYALILRDSLEQNRSLILVGSLYKFAYFTTTLWYFLNNAIPHMAFIAFAIADFIMFIPMIQCYFVLRKKTDD